MASASAPAAGDRERGIPIEYWPALLTFSAHSPAERDTLHGPTGKGNAGAPSPFSELASRVGGWRHLKNWELGQDAHGDVIDKSGRKVIPLECFDFFIYAAALDVFSKHEHFDSRISAAAVIAVLAAANISAGSLSGQGGRPPMFSISSQNVIALLGDTDFASAEAASTSSCAFDPALNNLFAARGILEGRQPLRRFLSFHPPSWPTAVIDSSVIDAFRSGTRRSIVWHAPTRTAMRRKLESIASLMEVCMSHTNTYEERPSGSCCDVFRCHRREKPKVTKVSVATNVDAVRGARAAALPAAVDATAQRAVVLSSDEDSDSDGSVSDASSGTGDATARPGGAASFTDEASIAASAAAHTARALRRAERTPVGVGCTCSWFLEQSVDGLTWMLIQRGQHTGHTPGSEESNSHLPLPAEADRAAAAGVSIEGEDPAQALNVYLGALHEARKARDQVRVYSDQDGKQLPGFANDPATSPAGVFRMRGGRHSITSASSSAAAAAATAPELSSCPPGRGTNAPHVCICGQPRVEFDAGGPTIQCTRMKTCPRGGVFHFATDESPGGCVRDADLDADGNFTCPSCLKELEDEDARYAGIAAADDLQEDAVVAAGFVEVAPAADVNAMAVDCGSESGPSAISLRLADARLARGLPTHATAFRSWCTPDEVSDLRAARKRAKRGGVRISAEYIPLLNQYASDAFGENWIAELHVEPTKEDPNVLLILAFSLTSRRILDMGARPGAHAVQLFDFTANTCGSSMQLGCVMGHLPEAGGMGFPLSFHLWLDAAHEDGELTKYTKFFLGYIRQHGLPPPRVLMLDKAVPVHNAALQLNQEALESEAARSAERQLLASLATVSLGRSDDEAAAGRRLVHTFPSFVSATGDVLPAGTMPLSVSDLRAEFPTLDSSPPLSEQAASQAKSLFLPGFVRQYGPGVVRGVADTAHSALSTVISQLRVVQSIGDWNVAAAQLLWLESFSAKDGPLELFLQQFVLVFVLLCIFHVLQALEKAARTRGYLPAAIVAQALARFRLVIDGKLSYDEYKSWLTPVLKSAGLKREDGTFAWFTYLDDHWRTSKWWSLVSSRFRSLLARFGVDTNNTLEGTWETIKNKWGAHFACRTITVLFKSLVGLPGDPTSQAQSWLAKRCSHFFDVLRGRQRVGGGYKRDRILLRLKRLIQLIESSPHEYVRDVEGVDPHLSEVWIGADTAGWRFRPSPAQGQDGALLLAKSVRLYRRYDLMACFKFKSLNECHFDDGRTLPGSGRAHNVAGIQRARSFATTAAAAHAAHVIDRATAAKAARGTPQAFLAQAVFALPHLAEDFQVLGKRGAQQQAVQLLLCSPAPLVEAVLELKDDLARPRGGGAAGSLGPEDVLTRIRMAIRDHALPCLRSTDWKGSKKPEHVGLIYVILLTLAACDIYRECTRVLVKGEAVSQMFHSLLGDGYKIALSQIFDLSTRLVADGRGDVLLTAVYVGQELRGAMSDARFLRVFEHGTLSGSDVISEFIHVTSKKQAKGVVCTPLGPVILERRLLAVLPPDAEKVNLAEGLWLAIFFLLFDAWVLNSSPTGSDQRFLVESWNGTVALAEQLGTATLERLGVSWANNSPIEEDRSAFMRRALAMTRRLLRAGLWVDQDGAPIAPAIPSRVGQAADYSWQQCFGSLIGHRATRKARYALWAMACSDPDCRDQVKSPVCVHGLYAMHRHILLGREPCIRSTDHEMYFAPPAAVSASSVVSFSSSAPAAPAPPPVATSNAECILRCAASVSSIALQMPSLCDLASAGSASSGGAGIYLSTQDRRILDNASNVLHRLAMQIDKSLHATGSATSFAGARTSQHRLTTMAAVARSHSSARGVEAADPGPVGLLRRQIAQLSGAVSDSDNAESDVSLVARAAQEAGLQLSTFVSQLSAGAPPLSCAAGGASHSEVDVPLAAPVAAATLPIDAITGTLLGPSALACASVSEVLPGGAPCPRAAQAIAIDHASDSGSAGSDSGSAGSAVALPQLVSRADSGTDSKALPVAFPSLDASASGQAASARDATASDTGPPGAQAACALPVPVAVAGIRRSRQPRHPTRSPVQASATRSLASAMHDSDELQAASEDDDGNDFDAVFTAQHPGRRDEPASPTGSGRSKRARLASTRAQADYESQAD